MQELLNKLLVCLAPFFRRYEMGQRVEDGQTDRQTDRQAGSRLLGANSRVQVRLLNETNEREAGHETERRLGRQTGRWISCKRQTNRQTDGERKKGVE